MANVTLDKVARDQQPFGIEVVVECDLGQPSPRGHRAGRDLFWLLDRLAKQRAVLLTTNEKASWC